MSKQRTKGKPLTREAARKIFAKYGIEELPRDHPIYREGPSIVFVNRRPGVAKPK